MCTLPSGILSKLGGVLRHSLQWYNSTTCWSDHLVLSVQAQPVSLTHSPKDQAQKFLLVCFLQRVGSAVLSAGQILVLLLTSRGVLLFCPCWEVLPPILGQVKYPSITPLCWSVLHRHVISPLLSHQSWQRDQSWALGQLLTHSSCPGDDGYTDLSWTAQLSGISGWCFTVLVIWSCHYKRLKVAPEVLWNSHSCTKSNNFALSSYWL